jgi:recombination protein RecA
VARYANLESLQIGEQSMSLDQALKEIEKRFGKGKVLPVSEAVGAKFRRISTGSLSLDIETGGGWIQGKFNELYGLPSGGKTFLALQTVAVNQQKYPTANFAWIDAEGAFDREWATKIGVDLDRLYITTPEFMEEALDIADILIKSQDMFLIVIDSWAALSPKNEFDGTMDDHNMGLRARTGNKFVRKTKPHSDLLKEDIDLGKTTILVINQLYQTLSQYTGDETPGGRQLNYLSLLRIRIRRGEVVQEKDGTVLVQEAIFVVEKNKTHPPKVKGSFLFSVKDNLDGQAGKIHRIDELLTYATKVGIINRAGAWYTLPAQYGLDKPLQGGKAVKEWFLEQSEEVLKEFEELVVYEATKHLAVQED